MKYNFEELSPEHLSDELEKRIVLLEKVIGDKTAVLNKAPVGRISITCCLKKVIIMANIFLERMTFWLEL